MRGILSYMRFQVAEELRYSPVLVMNIMMIVVAAYIAQVLLPSDLGIELWLTVFWVIVFLVLTTSFSQSFNYELDRGHYLMYQLIDPAELLLSKFVFNILKSLFLHFVVWMIMAVFFSSSVFNDRLEVLIILCVSAVAISVTLTFVAAIAQRARQSSGVLFSVLGLPLLMTMVWLLSGYSRRILIFDGEMTHFLNLSAAFIIIVMVSSLFLFSYLWKE